MIVRHDELAALRQLHLVDDIAYCGGVFDLLHEGHLDVLSKLHEFGNVAVVGVASDERVKYKKGTNRPIHSEHARLAIIDALRHVDYTFIYPNQAPASHETISHYILKQLIPDFFVTSDEVREEDRAWLAQQGTTLKIIPRFSDEISTTQTIQKVLATNTPN